MFVMNHYSQAVSAPIMSGLFIYFSFGTSINAGYLVFLYEIVDIAKILSDNIDFFLWYLR